MIPIAHFVEDNIQKLIELHEIDVLLIEPEDGFSQLGNARTFLTHELGLKDRNLVQWTLNGMKPDFEPSISSLTDWARHTDPDVNLIAIPSNLTSSKLKGLILVPYADSLCYKQFAQGEFAKPYRDFFYNVTYEALFYALHIWKAKRPAIAHLSREKYRGVYKQDITTCQVEASIHICNEFKGFEKITFWDCTVGNDLEACINYLEKNQQIKQHRKIKIDIQKHGKIDFVGLNWNKTDNL
jgi:hypothetical protein